MRFRGFPIALVLVFFVGCADDDPPAPLGPEVGAHSMAKGKGKGGDPPPPADPAIVYLDYNRGKKGQGDRLVVMNEDGSNQTEIHSAPHLLRPSWSPLGESIVFRRDSDTKTELWIVDVLISDGKPEGSNPRRLTGQCGASVGAPFFGCEPAWSPQGSDIAFTDEGDNLWVIAADGTQTQRPELLHSGHWLVAPAWSPDGERIAVVDSLTLIRVITRDGTVDRTLDFTTDFHLINDLDWASTSDMLAFSGVAKRGGEAVYTVDLSEDTPTATKVARGESPAWSPDDRHLALIKQPGQRLISLDLSAGTATSLSPDALDPDWAR
jgi:Tol biopolymer transport system component